MDRYSAIDYDTYEVNNYLLNICTVDQLNTLYDIINGNKSINMIGRLVYAAIDYSVFNNDLPLSTIIANHTLSYDNSLYTIIVSFCNDNDHVVANLVLAILDMGFENYNIGDYSSVRNVWHIHNNKYIYYIKYIDDGYYIISIVLTMKSIVHYLNSTQSTSLTCNYFDGKYIYCKSLFDIMHGYKRYTVHKFVDLLLQINSRNAYSDDEYREFVVLNQHSLVINNNKYTTFIDNFVLTPKVLRYLLNIKNYKVYPGYIITIPNFYNVATLEFIDVNIIRHVKNVLIMNKFIDRV